MCKFEKTKKEKLWFKKYFIRLFKEKKKIFETADKYTGY